MADYLIAGLGEILWDVLDCSEQIGGAPINFAYHVGALGASSVAVSTIGNDKRGRRALEELGKRGLNLDAVSIDPDHDTGYVKARVDDQGVAHYIFPDDIAWDHLKLNEKARTMAPKVDAVCFGTLAQRSRIARKSIHNFLDAAPQALKVFDMNLRQNFYSEEIISDSLKRSDVLKLNDDEIRIVAGMYGIKGSDRVILRAIHERHQLRLSVLTRGGNGSIIISDNEEIESPGVKVNRMADTIGAGDSFTASTVLGLLTGRSLLEVSDHANRLAAHVCSCRGAMPPIPTEFRLV